MAPVAVGRDVVVFDHAMEPTVFGAIGHELAHGRYDSVHAQGWDKAWRLTDGTPMRGGGVYYDPTHAFDRPGARYPTSSVVDTFIDELRRLSAEHPEVVGREGVDWVAIFLSPWLYPVGSALSLHRDGGAYSGAFTYFAHPRWGVHWGGELLVLDDDHSSTSNAPQGVTGWMEDDEVGSALATCVFPQPNRLVFVGPDRPHMVRRVDPNAGDHVRTSLAGFFLRP
jgi:Rps23 Pro-64 3,4-dihydroxylase Tpa1-like proline 4-hydroxylase